MNSSEVQLSPGMPVMLLEGNWLHDAHVTGQGAGFVSIQLGTGVRLVRRHSIYSLPHERGRLQQDIQAGIDQLGRLHDKLARTDDPIPFCQE